jgi:hypothetical protein
MKNNYLIRALFASFILTVWFIQHFEIEEDWWYPILNFLFVGNIFAIFGLMAKGEQWRLKDPLYLIIIGLIVLCILISLFFDPGWTIMLFFVLNAANLFLIQISDPDYDIGEGIDKAARLSGRCPYCLKKVSRLARKCPHCTSTL